MAVYLTPHTGQWFEALQQFNPDQALHTALVIERAGRSDVCSICANTPTRDYMLPEEGLPPEAVATIRLCPDCAIFRASIGDALTPFYN